MAEWAGNDRLEDLSVQPYRVATSPKWEPVQVNARFRLYAHPASMKRLPLRRIRKNADRPRGELPCPQGGAQGNSGKESRSLNPWPASPATTSHGETVTPTAAITTNPAATALSAARMRGWPSATAKPMYTEAIATRPNA